MAWDGRLVRIQAKNRQTHSFVAVFDAWIMADSDDGGYYLIFGYAHSHHYPNRGRHHFIFCILHLIFECGYQLLEVGQGRADAVNQTVLITGGARGIGAQTVREFVKNGYQTAFCYEKNIDAANALAKETGALAIRADVSDFKQVHEMVSTLHSHYGNVDVLVNNAGIAQQKLFSDITEDDWDRMFAVNSKGLFLCTQAVLPDMIHKKCGSIVNVSSIWGIAGASCEVHYSASKAAVIGFTKALAKEVGLSGIRVNCVAPGVVDTDMNQNLDRETMDALKEETPLCRIGTAADIAKSILFFASPASEFITGQVLSPNGGIVI
jgi:3-oxoacyl-[acyl-carrier protein] reductase